ATLFALHRTTGWLTTNTNAFDRETVDEYNLTVQATDCDGQSYGLSSTTYILVSISDINDNSPEFVSAEYSGAVWENTVNVTVVWLTVRDRDAHGTAAWHAVYTITRGNDDGAFGVRTDTQSNEGVVFTSKGLDFESAPRRALELTVQNAAPLLTPGTQLPSLSQCTLHVSISDLNEPPVFRPHFMVLPPHSEGLPPGSSLANLTATDPDANHTQMLRFVLGQDPASWLVLLATGEVLTQVLLDRESPHVFNDSYVATALVVDDGNQDPGHLKHS
uniref:Cadherin domain-containing protein n=1 Tax=Eptatretus burgeri TaxID=7764 RepID=A0A8C4Q311_EPTBU